MPNFTEELPVQICRPSTSECITVIDTDVSGIGIQGYGFRVSDTHLDETVAEADKLCLAEFIRAKVTSLDETVNRLRTCMEQ